MKLDIFLFAANGLFAIWNVYDGDALWAAINAFAAGAIAVILAVDVMEARS